MKIKGKPLLYWFAFGPVVLFGAAAVLAAVITLWGAIQDAPVFTIGAIFFVLWTLWGAWYLHKTDAEAYRDEYMKMSTERCRREVINAGADAAIAGTPCPYPDHPSFANYRQWWNEGWQKGEELKKRLEK